MTGGPIVGDDGVARCPWGDAPAAYRDYHDSEWGRPVRGDRAIFERLALEAFQAGLSWLTVLRRREALRDGFMGFDIASVAALDSTDVDRLLGDSRLIRHRGKIEAIIHNARVLAVWQADEGEGVLDARVWACRTEISRPRVMSEVPAMTDASRELAADLKRRGWRFIGPTSAYAALQAMGVVDDHLVGCHARGSARQGGVTSESRLTG